MSGTESVVEQAKEVQKTRLSIINLLPRQVSRMHDLNVSHNRAHMIVLTKLNERVKSDHLRTSKQSLNVHLRTEEQQAAKLMGDTLTIVFT